MILGNFQIVFVLALLFRGLYIWREILGLFAWSVHFWEHVFIVVILNGNSICFGNDGQITLIIWT